MFGRAVWIAVNRGTSGRRLRHELYARLQRADPSGLPIVISDPIQYLKIAHSAPQNLKPLLVYTPDAEKALKYTGMNSGDYNLSGLRGLAPLNLPTYASFTGAHR
jgi:hypothetical protein